MASTITISDFGYPAAPGMPFLHSGDRLSREEFHRRYETYPDKVVFELIGGIVYMASPARLDHGTYHPQLSAVLNRYEAATPGVQLADNTSVLLDDENEVQPDLLLRILPECGGQSTTTDKNYVAGAPELVAEISHSTVAIDLHAKKDSYQKAGVLEYIVVCIGEQEIRWFDMKTDELLPTDEKGLVKSKVFPGLWLDTQALLDKNSNRLIEALQQGLATDEHAQFVRQLKDTKS